MNIHGGDSIKYQELNIGRKNTNYCTASLRRYFCFYLATYNDKLHLSITYRGLFLLKFYDLSQLFISDYKYMVVNYTQK